MDEISKTEFKNNIEKSVQYWNKVEGSIKTKKGELADKTEWFVKSFEPVVKKVKEWNWNVVEKESVEFIEEVKSFKDDIITGKISNSSEVKERTKEISNRFNSLTKDIRKVEKIDSTIEELKQQNIIRSEVIEGKEQKVIKMNSLVEKVIDWEWKQTYNITPKVKEIFSSPIVDIEKVKTELNLSKDVSSIIDMALWKIKFDPKLVMEINSDWERKKKVESEMWWVIERIQTEGKEVKKVVEIEKIKETTQNIINSSNSIIKEQTEISKVDDALTTLFNWIINSKDWKIKEIEKIVEIEKEVKNDWVKEIVIREVKEIVNNQLPWYEKEIIKIVEEKGWEILNEVEDWKEYSLLENQLIKIASLFSKESKEDNESTFMLEIKRSLESLIGSEISNKEKKELKDIIQKIESWEQLGVWEWKLIEKYQTTDEWDNEIDEYI